MIRNLSLDELIDEWPERGPHLRRMLKDVSNRFDVRSVLDWIAEGKIHVIGDDARRFTAIWMVQQYPKGRGGLLYGLAGEGMRDWLDDLVAHFEAEARKAECDFIECGGRKGWGRMLRPEKTRATYERKL